MQTIKLTDASTGKVIRLCPDYIVAYWWQNDAHTYIILGAGSKIFARVKETAEEIDKLLSEVP